MKSVAIAILFLLCFFLSISKVQASSSTTLIFNLDQGFANGISNQLDLVGLRRVVAVLQKMQKTHTVYALVSPLNKDKTKLSAVLDILSQNNIPFVIDAVSSDCNTITGGSKFDQGSDNAHGICLSLDQVTQLKKTYGWRFAGIRVFEMYSMDFTWRACKTTNPEWCKEPRFVRPADSFYERGLIEPFVKYAHDTNMTVIWSEFHWKNLNAWDTPLGPQEDDLHDMISKYPNTIIPMFANNLPDNKAKSYFQTGSIQ